MELKHVAVYECSPFPGTLRQYLKHEGRWFWREWEGLKDGKFTQCSRWYRSAAGCTSEFALDHIVTTVGPAYFARYIDTILDL